jgi:hypothetical protein
MSGLSNAIHEILHGLILKDMASNPFYGNLLLMVL